MKSTPLQIVRRGVTGFMALAFAVSLSSCAVAAPAVDPSTDGDTGAPAEATPNSDSRWPLSTDAPVKGSSPSWDAALSDEWRELDGSDANNVVYRNGLCRLTLKKNPERTDIESDDAGTTEALGNLRDLFSQIPQVSNLSFDSRDSYWLDVDGTSAEFATLSFTYSAAVTEGTQEWSAFYMSRAFGEAETTLEALGECQSVPLSEQHGAILLDARERVSVALK